MKHNIKFDLFPQKENGVLVDCRPIRMRVSYAGKRVELRVGHSIEVGKWDKAKGRVLNGYKNRYKQSSGEINKALSSCEAIIDEIIEKYKLLEKRMPTEEELKTAFNEAAGRTRPEQQDKNRSFYNIYNTFMQTVGEQNSWRNATYTKFKTLREHLQGYDINLEFDTFTEQSFQGFISYLHRKNLRNTTIAKTVAFLKWFLRWAYNNDYYNGKLHDSFKARLKGTDGNAKEIIYLEWEELLNLYSFDFSARPSLAAVRDVFCFCCFTGLRYSDVAKLKRDDVKKDFIVVITQKTVDGLKIELNKYSRSILDKYRNIPLPFDKALPVISNAKMNEHLKEMGQIAGINDPQRIVYFKGNVRHEEVYPKYVLLTTHCGRRTFIVNALYLGIPAEVVMRWTGHSDYQAMKPYIKIVDELKKQEMAKFDQK